MATVARYHEQTLCTFVVIYLLQTELRGMVSYSALKAVCAAGDDVERQRKALKKLFGSFVKCDKNVVRTQVCAPGSYYLLGRMF